MSQVTVFAPAAVIVSPIGTTRKARLADGVCAMTKSAQFATMMAGGVAAKACAAAHGAGAETVATFASEAAWPACDYKGLAQFINGQIDKPVVISNRVSFMALPDAIEGHILALKGKKGGGYKAGSDGVSVPTPALRVLMVMKALVCEVVALEAEISAEKKAAAASKQNPAIEAS